MDPNIIKKYKEFQESPLVFIEHMWGLVPQPLKEEFFDEAQEAINEGKWQDFKPEWFMPFEKGKHITWQQWVIVLMVERAMNDLGPRRISISSGHGIGKDAILSMLILWYLFCHKDAQVPCTAPSSEQMYDILWKEIALWLRRMPKPAQDVYEWSASYVRIKERYETWFARAKTARKEAPEALAGVHGEYVFMAVDEASGVAEEIYNTAEGALTNENILVFLISNPTRLQGYFYDSHHKFRENWQCIQFDSRESPIVDKQFVEGIIAKHGEDSDEFKIRVAGVFANEDAVDKQGYVPMFGENDIKEVADMGKFRPGWARLGIDPAGEGRNETIFVVRDRFRAKIAAVEKISTGLSIADKAIQIMDLFGIPDWQVTVDAFGVGKDCIQELAMAGFRVHAVNTGDPLDADDPDKALYINMRAQSSWRARMWIKKGGELVRNPRWKQLLTVRYRRQLSGKLKVMDKAEMRKQGIPSPDAWDAFSLTFCRDDNYEVNTVNEVSDDDINNAVGVYGRRKR